MNETKLYFNSATKVIFASADAQDAAIQSVTLDQVAGLVDDGATIDSSAAAAGASTGTGTPAASGRDGGNDGSDAPAIPTSNVADSGDAGTAVADLGNGAPAVAQSGKPADTAVVAGMSPAATDPLDSSSATVAKEEDSGITTSLPSALQTAGVESTDLEAANAKIADLESQIETLNATIAEKTAQIGALQSAAAATEADHPAHEVIDNFKAKIERGEALIVEDIVKAFDRVKALL